MWNMKCNIILQYSTYRVAIVVWAVRVVWRWRRVTPSGARHRRTERRPVADVGEVWCLQTYIYKTLLNKIK